MKTKKQTDNGSPEIKALLRLKLIKRIKPANALDLYAGEGRMLAAVAPAFKRMIAVEKDPHKFIKLCRAVENNVIPNARPHCMDNLRFVKTRLPELEGINYIDLDAYGCPNRLVREIFQSWRPTTQTAFAVTDGGRIYLCRGNRMGPADYFPENGRDGPASRAGNTVRLPPGLVGDYELLVKNFWKTLAGRYGFRVVDYLSVWRKARRVLYYGVCIEPD